MTTSGGFEPTEAQSGVDPNMFTLIDPETIPYPLTDVWSLNFAAEKLRSGGEDLAGDAEDMRSTWTGLQAHYSAPESDDLFSKMDPVVTRGEGIEADLGTVAGSLEDLSEAAATARRKLNTLRIEAQGFYNRNKDKAVWWLDKDDETDEFALLENIRLKDEVNTAWSAFNEAENTCATTISSVYGGAAYVAPDQARGEDVIVYGLPTDMGEREMDFTTLFTNSANGMAAWFDEEYWISPDEVRFGDGTGIGQAAWDTIVTDILWGSAVGLVSFSGVWSPQNGWRLDPSGRFDNLKNNGWDALVDAATLVGVHDDRGWLFDSDTGGASWARWTGNLGDVVAEKWEAHTSWSHKDDDPEYTGATSTINTVLLVGGLPLKVVKGLLTLGPGGHVGDGDGAGSDRPGFGDDDQHSPEHGRPLSGESSPWPRDGDAGSAPTGERFDHGLDILRESLLDPNRYRDAPTPQPDRPSPTDDSAPAPQNPATATPEDHGDTPDTGLPEHQNEQGAGNDPREAAESREPATDDGSDQPPRDRTSTGGGEEGTDGPTGEGGASSGPPQPPEPPEQPPYEPNGDDGDDGEDDGEDGGGLPRGNREQLLDVFPNRVDTEESLPRPEQTKPPTGRANPRLLEEITDEGLVGPGWEHFNEKEKEVAEFLRTHGIETVSIKESTVDGVRTPEAAIAGTGETVEFKILESDTARSFERNIRSARGQSRRMVFDVRHLGTSQEDAVKGLGKGLYNYGGDVSEIVVIGDGYTIVWP